MLGEGPPSRDGTLFGRYLLSRRLAVGGMAEVFIGRYQGLAGFERPVVIKRILKTLANEPRYVEMFLSEARIAARLSHPNICQVYDLGEIEGSYFLAMEFLEGVPLMTLLNALARSGRPSDSRLVASIFTQAAEGLHHAHELRDDVGRPLEVVHRDVGPQNLFITTAGAVKVLDFGIARASFRAVTQSGVLKGTYAYMSPEQLRGQPLDRRSDIFALGVVLHEILAQRPLFERATEYLISSAITREPIPRTPTPEDAPGLAVAADRALQRDRARRTPTARAFGLELSAAVDGIGGPMPWGQVGDLLQRMCGLELDAQRFRAGLPPLPSPVATPVLPEIKPTARIRSTMPPSGRGPDAQTGEPETEVVLRDDLLAGMEADALAEVASLGDELHAPTMADEPTSLRMRTPNGISDDADPAGAGAEDSIAADPGPIYEETTEQAVRPVVPAAPAPGPSSAPPLARVAPVTLPMPAPVIRPFHAPLPTPTHSTGLGLPGGDHHTSPFAPASRPPVAPTWRPPTPPARPLSLVVPRRRRWVLIAAVLGGVMVLGTGVLLFRGGSGGEAGLPPDAARAPQPTGGAAPAAPDAPPAAPERPRAAPSTPARIRVGGKPGRKVAIDGTEVGSSPLIVPVAPGLHTVSVDGAPPIKVEVTLGSTLTVP